MIRDAKLHCRGDAVRFVNAAEVVVRHVQADRGHMVLDPLVRATWLAALSKTLDRIYGTD